MEPIPVGSVNIRLGRRIARLPLRLAQASTMPWRPSKVEQSLHYLCFPRLLGEPRACRLLLQFAACLLEWHPPCRRDHEHGTFLKHDPNLQKGNKTSAPPL